MGGEGGSDLEPGVRGGGLGFSSWTASSSGLTVSMSFNLPVPQFSHLYNWDNILYSLAWFVG